MPLDHSKATATVSVTGLSFGCFNPETRKWEVALIRHPRHKLTINVTTFAADNSSTQETYEIDRNPQREITIEAVNPIIPTDNEVIYKKDPFDRQNPGSSDDEDFRWIVDLEKEFNGNKPIPVIHPAFPITPLFVSFPVLYADPDDKLDQMELVNLSARQAGDPKPFGTLAETAKADITCEPGGSVVFKVGGPDGYTIELPHLEGVAHEIRIENICPEDQPGREPREQARAPLSDFSIYFSLIQPKSGQAFDLKKKDGPLGSDAVCNNTYLGERTSLFPMS